MPATTTLRLALCQINPTVGDIAGNAGLIERGIAAAGDAGADLVLFPELALTGYPPEDLLLAEHFLDDARGALRALAAAATDVVAIVGTPEHAGGATYNCAALLAGGRVLGLYRKLRLPNYGVFDERRYFEPGARGAVVTIGGVRVGLTVCEDMWAPGPPAAWEAAAGARLLVNISASPYHAGKGREREQMFAARARDSAAHVAFCGQVGGQDELVFDGHSFVVDPSGAVLARGAQFAPDLVICDLALERSSGRSEEVDELGELPARATRPPHATRAPASLLSEEEEVYAALCLGLRDYVEKNGFAHVVLGLSGGIDSALVACIAADALGRERVSTVVMPSPHSSEATQSDARALAANLGTELIELPIAALMEAYEHTLDGVAEDGGLTAQNIQARIRGNLLMALSNSRGWLVLTTGNKSEMSVGYSTLYGDLAGGLAVIKDVPKGLVYRLAHWRNQRDPAIPASILERAPSAELAPGQRDTDSLPPYDLLDRILHGYVELAQGPEQLVAQGLPEDVVRTTLRRVDLAEYKRRQAPPGIKVTTRAFGRDRRMPITNAHRP